MKAYTTLALKVYESTPYTNAAYVFAKGGITKKTLVGRKSFFKCNAVLSHSFTQMLLWTL